MTNFATFSILILNRSENETFKITYRICSNSLFRMARSFLDETAGLGKDMISIAQGKSQKEIDLEKEVKNQKRILKAQQLAQEQIDFEN